MPGRYLFTLPKQGKKSATLNYRIRRIYRFTYDFQPKAPYATFSYKMRPKTLWQKGLYSNCQNILAVCVVPFGLRHKCQLKDFLCIIRLNLLINSSTKYLRLRLSFLVAADDSADTKKSEVSLNSHTSVIQFMNGVRCNPMEVSINT